MNQTIKPSPRQVVRKVILSDEEDLALSRKCSALGVQRSPMIRQLINGWARLKIKPPRRGRAGAFHGHVVNFPNRAAFGGAPVPLRL